MKRGGNVRSQDNPYRPIVATRRLPSGVLCARAQVRWILCRRSSGAPCVVMKDLPRLFSSTYHPRRLYSRYKNRATAPFCLRECRGPLAVGAQRSAVAEKCTGHAATGVNVLRGVVYRSGELTSRNIAPDLSLPQVAVCCIRFGNPFLRGRVGKRRHAPADFS